MLMKENETYQIEVNDAVFECHVDVTLMPGIRRALTGTTPTDSEIDQLSIPQHPFWLLLVTKALRWYRRSISPALGNRCVFEPSCSHYAELALRKYGFIHGCSLTVRRLYRCRPGAGGIDVPE